jgi:Uma2 family endonuclease
VVVPDLQFIATERRTIIKDKNVQGAPDLVIEILSPSTGRIDRGLKRARYERLGVFEYWILDADRDIATVYRRARREDARFLPPQLLSATASDRLISPLFPSLEIDLRDIFTR